MSFDLRTVLTEDDKAKIENYVTLYGVAKDCFIGTDEYLKFWAASKPKLYRMMGKQLRVSIPVEIPKEDEILYSEIQALTRQESYNEDGFCTLYSNFVSNTIKPVLKSDWSWDLNDAFNGLLSIGTLSNNKVVHGFKVKPEGFQKTLQIQKDGKPMKAILKVLTYFNASNELMKAFERFRLAHSLIFNDAKLKGKLVLSIHPLDFITMSDNSLGWSSCMSWMDDGCFHIGTVEMMNSNNVICCYLESDTPFYFGKHDNEKQKEDSNFYWTNKKWRQLIYVDKDILVSGKSYPYYNESLTKKALEVAKDLAAENFKWEFKFGVERYLDMKNVYSGSRMEQNRDWMRDKDDNKFNILFDSKGMYNDMLNDNNYKYWCYRNKPKHRKIICYSGKANCLCCNESVIYRNDDDYYYYNDRYNGVGHVVCDDCWDSNRCNQCGKMVGKKNLVWFDRYDTGEKNEHWCKECFEAYAKKCPCCGRTMKIFSDRYNLYIRTGDKHEIFSDNDPYTLISYKYPIKQYPDAVHPDILTEKDVYRYNREDMGNPDVVPGMICNNCVKALKNYILLKQPNDLLNLPLNKFILKNFNTKINKTRMWGGDQVYFISKKIYPDLTAAESDPIKPFLYPNLKQPDFKTE